ncbi:MAG TPA: hypothetical protein VNC18_02800 [Gemmatimonadaceae bacterium]|nr:hypothetical protein [Gemmatimonadaceae bacterium]
MSHTSSAVFAITVFAAPIVALGVVLARTGGAPRRTVARAGSVASTAVTVLIALTLLTDLPPDSSLRAIAIIIALSFVPAMPWLLLRDEKPTETPLVLSMLISGALAAVFALLGLLSTFGASVAESTSIGAGPGGLFVLLPAGAYVALELKVFLAVREMMKDSAMERATQAAAARARQPVVASPKDAKLRVRFEGCEEIRMGSPYHACTLRLDGEWTPALPADGWIRISAFSPDRRFTGLAHWDSRDNAPGFRIFTIDCVERNYELSDRIDGYCQSLAWSDDKFVPLVWHAQR